MRYSLEIDALNALVAEQRKTNELLERLVSHGLHTNAKGSVNDTVGHKRNVHESGIQDGTVQSGAGSSKLRPGRKPKVRGVS